MKNILILIVLLLAPMIFSQWTQTNGPEGAEISSLFSIGTTVYAGTGTNGMYVSNDDGVNWMALNSGMENLEISEICADSEYIFAGTFGQGVYRSSDNGQTWLPPSNYGNVVVDAMIVTDNYVFAGTQSLGVLRSSDHGNSWILLSYPVGYIDAMGVSGNRIFASQYVATYVSTDDGETWNEVSSLTTKSVRSFFSSGNLVIGGGFNEVYRSTNQGVSFSTIPIAFDFGVVNIFSITKVGLTLFIATSYDGVYKSTDDGLTWTPSNNGMGPKDVRALTTTSSLTLIAGSHYSGLYRSVDAALSWNKSMSGFFPGASLLTFYSTGTTLFAGTRDGIYRTQNNGLSWNKLTGTNDTINYGQIRGITKLNGALYASTFYKFHSTVYKSTDNGVTWGSKATGLPSDLTFVYGLATSGNNIIAGTDEGLFYSSDEGSSWNATNIPNTDIPGVVAGGSNFVYAIVQSSGIYRSADSGINWSPNLQLGSTLTGLSARDNFVYVGTFFNQALYSLNYASGWDFCNGFLPGESVIAIENIGNGMVVAADYPDLPYIYASFDNGVNFTPYSEGLGQNAVTEFIAVTDSFVFAGTDYNGVWRRLLPQFVPVDLNSFTASVNENNVTLSWQTATETNNNGFQVERLGYSEIEKSQEWENVGFVEGHGTTTEEHNYTYVDENISTGNYKYRIKQIDYDGSFEYSEIVSVNISGPSEFSLEQNYPNPFNPSTTIKFSIPEAGNVKLIVFNSLGEEIIKLVDEHKEAGIYKVNFNAQDVPSGIYFYKIESGRYNDVKKMVLVK